jgi:hypothetical protein
MGTPRARKSSKSVAPVVAQSSRTERSRRPAPNRPESFLHGSAFKALDLPVRPDKRSPVRPISVRHVAQIGSKTL